jgi:hypothetical protein
VEKKEVNKVRDLVISVCIISRGICYVAFIEDGSHDIERLGPLPRR